MNKNLFSWLVYDFANSFITTALGGLFLAQWVILDNKFDDIWYGGAFTLATILVLLTSPLWGAWSDKTGRRLPFIKWLTTILIALSGLLSFIAPSTLPSVTRIVSVLFLTVLIQYFYQLSLIFYNALLKQLSSERNRGKISGLGDGFGNFGWILGSAVLLQFANKKITLWGEPGRAQVFLPAFILFSLFSLPMLLWFIEKKEVVKNTNKINFKSIYAKMVEGLRSLIGSNKNVAIFLIAFSFVSDAILTIQLYFGIIMDRLYGISDNQKFLILTLMFVFVILGGYFLGKISDIVGTKKIIILSCIDLIVIFSIAFLSSKIWILYLLAFLGGIGWGGFYATSRALLIKISPLSQLGEYFGFYSTFQRFASIIGPIMWGVIILLLKDYGDIKYQVAAFSLIFLMVVGVCILAHVKEEKVEIV